MLFAGSRFLQEDVYKAGMKIVNPTRTKRKDSRKNKKIPPNPQVVVL
jgi:hypothetical protein